MPFRPAYIPTSLSQAPPDFFWRGAHQHCGPVTAWTPLLEKLDNITSCAQISLCAGVLAWAAYRLMDATDLAPSSLELAEAAFAYQIDWRYTDRTAGDVYEAPDTPPALSALMEVMGYLWEGVSKDHYWDNYYAPIRQTFHASHVTQRLMTKEQRPAFVEWFEFAIGRVQQHARRPPEPVRKMQEFDTLDSWKQFVAPHRGPPLPPDILDPAVDYRPEEREARVAAFLSTLDWHRNRYLRSPDAMHALGFAGNPYPHLREGH